MISNVKAIVGLLDRANGSGHLGLLDESKYIVNNKIKQIDNTHEDLLETYFWHVMNMSPKQNATVTFNETKKLMRGG